MFSLTCTVAAGLLAAFSYKKYKFIAWLVAIEFALHFITYNYLFLDFRANNSAAIYLFYIIIQVVILDIMYNSQTHLIIAILIFSNLAYNFFTILQHIGLTSINFHGPYVIVVRTIMVLELLYLLGITTYVGHYLRKHGTANIDHIDNLFHVRRWFPFGNLA